MTKIPGEQLSWRRFPWPLLVASLGLVCIGLSGIHRADQVGASGGHFEKQVLWAILAIPTILISLAIPYRVWKYFSYPVFAATLPLLVVVFFMPARNGARCWIPLGFFDMQPSELAKIGFIMALAHYLMYRANHRTLPGLFGPFLVTLIPIGLILKEPDLGSAILFLPILFSMLFAAGAQRTHLAMVVMMGIAALPLGWNMMSAEQRSRITATFTQVDGGGNPGGDGYHLHQSKQVLAFGGVWGSELSGTLLDDPIAYHLPAGQTDFVFCWIAERWGLIGVCLTLGLYLVMIGQGLSIAANTREPFGRLVVVGVVTLLATQALINTSMTVGLLPIVGITFPLISYGGTSLLTTAASIGLMMNVAIRPGYEISQPGFRSPQWS